MKKFIDYLNKVEEKKPSEKKYKQTNQIHNNKNTRHMLFQIWHHTPKYTRKDRVWAERIVFVSNEQAVHHIQRNYFTLAIKNLTKMNLSTLEQPFVWKIDARYTKAI